MRVTLDDIAEVRDQILGCNNCDLRGHVEQPVPFFGPMNPRVLIIGQAPGAQEVKQGRPFIGSAGQELRKILSKNGIPDETCLYTNVTACYERGEKGDKEPTIKQAAACRPNLQSVLTLATPKVILVLGRVALRSLRTDVDLGRIHGRSMLYIEEIFGQKIWWQDDGVHVMATYHPSAGLRNPKYLRALENDIATLKKYMSDGWMYTEGCCKCKSEDVAEWDETGLAYCSSHRSQEVPLFD